jgi:hypothetical protein
MIFNVPIPPRMQGLEKDHRGYPIPVIILRDSKNLPHFTINNEVTRILIVAEDLCAICGQKLLPLRWFVGGPLSAFHRNGAYFDTPLHYECMTYAMQVCPYLALPSYSGRIDSRTLSKEETATRIFIDRTQIPERPEVFVCGLTHGQKLTNSGHMIPKRPWKKLEFWRQGKRLTYAKGKKIADAALQTYQETT